MLVKGETMKLGEHIANLRKEQNLSQEQLAEMVGDPGNLYLLNLRHFL